MPTHFVAGSTRSQPRRAGGFTLIEIMIGVVISLIGVVIILQMMSIFEARRRTTSTGVDAQVAGTVGMFALERELRLGGMGFANGKADLYGTPSLLGCTVNAYRTAAVSGTAGAFTFKLAPVEITQGAGGTPDTITVVYGNTSYSPEPKVFTLSDFESKRLSETRVGFNPGDLVVAAVSQALPLPPVCNMFQVSSLSGTDPLMILHQATTFTNFYTNDTTYAARYNDPLGTGTLFPGGGTLFNLGPAHQAKVGTTIPAISGPQVAVWQISGRNMVRSETITNSAAIEMAEGVIDLQAEYGIDTNSNNQIEAAEWTTTAPTDWSKLRAVRVAILARSQQFEKDPVTTTAPTYWGGSFVMRGADGSTDTNTAGDPNNWRHYRYKVYEKVIPLRNLIWRND